MAEKRKKRKRKSKGSGDEPTVGARAHVEDEGGGGGLLQSIRTGFRQAAGVEESKPSRASNIFWTVLLIAAAALLLYRWYG